MIDCSSQLVFVIPSLQVGGAETQTILQVNTLHQQGYRVFLVVLSNKNAILLPKVLLPANQIFLLQGKYNTFTFKSILKSGGLLFELLKIFIQKIPFCTLQNTVVVANLPFAHWHLRLVKFFLSLQKRQSAFKLVIYHRSVQYQYPEKLLNTVPKRIFNYLHSVLARCCDNATICISKAVQNNINQYFVTINSTVLYNTLPLKNIEEVEANFFLEQFYFYAHKNKNFVILVPGRLHAVKGHLFFLEAFKIWYDTLTIFDKQNVRLIIAGGGALSTEIEQFIAQNKWQDIVLLTHNIEHTVLLSLYKIASVVVIPSVSEGLGNVAIEALMQGALVLCSNAGGLPEVIQSGYNGFVFEVLNTEQLIDFLKQIHKNKHNILQENIFISYKQKFDFELHINKLKNILLN